MYLCMYLQQRLAFIDSESASLCGSSAGAVGPELRNACQKDRYVVRPF